jgi:hypothetical protein
MLEAGRLLPPTAASRAPATCSSAGGGSVAKFREQFSDKAWKKCCGHGCKKCDIHNAYLAEYGKKQGEKKFQKDHDKMH